MSKRFILTIATVIVLTIMAGVVIFLAKGYTFSPEEKRIVGTGILTVNSKPDAASVFVDGHLTTATNATISSLPPKQYKIRVVKEGFIPWEKEVNVKEGLVTELKVTLFPAIPTIYPLTFSGVANPILSPDGDKLAYIVSSGKKAGVWVWTMSKDQPIAFARSSEPHQIAKTSQTIDYSTAILKWSPDSKQVLVTLNNNNYLMSADNFSDEPRDITPVLDATLKSWEEDVENREQVRLVTIADVMVRKVASDSAVVKWSPDETKFIYREKALDDKQVKGETEVDGMKVYDLENRKEFSLPEAKSHMWLPDSIHVILVDDGSVSVSEYDGSNKAVIFAGSFQNNFAFPWPDSSRLVIISSFPTPTASEPNLYGINLR
ncbi:PEGA domain-containing protein [Candidatus Daviesbacteria bacterium]|nr:PEGA domain-containing protein [Candidatus Daviesbacteria bacterium]